MLAFPPIVDPWFEGLKTSKCKIRRTPDRIFFKLRSLHIRRYRLLIYPILDCLILWVFTQFFLGELEDSVEFVYVLSIAAWGFVLRLSFMVIDLTSWYDFSFRNRSPHRRLCSSFSIPIMKSGTGKVDKTRSIYVDKSSFLGIQIVDVVIAGNSSGILFNNEVQFNLDARSEELPQPWSNPPKYSPFFSPTLVLEDEAFELFRTRDLNEAVDFTRRLRFALDLSDPVRLVGHCPFQQDGHRSFASLLCIQGGLGLILLFAISSTTAFADQNIAQIFLQVPAYYLLNEAVVLLCGLSLTKIAIATGQRNVKLLKDGPTPPRHVHRSSRKRG